MTIDTTHSLQVRLDEATIRKAERLAALRGRSVSELLAELIEHLVGDDKEYEAHQGNALAEMADGYRLGGQMRAAREAWHQR